MWLFVDFKGHAQPQSEETLKTKSLHGVEEKALVEHEVDCAHMTEHSGLVAFHLLC